MSARPSSSNAKPSTREPANAPTRSPTASLAAHRNRPTPNASSRSTADTGPSKIHAITVLDWIYDEDRCRIRTGYGPENITRLRRFAISLIKARGVANVAQKIRELNWNPRLLFDYLRMTQN